MLPAVEQSAQEEWWPRHLVLYPAIPISVAATRNTTVN